MWTEEQKEWLTKEFRQWPPDFVASRFNKQFNTSLSTQAVSHAYRRLYQPQRVGPREKPLHKWTPDQVTWLRNEFYSSTHEVVVQRFNAEFHASVNVASMVEAFRRHCPDIVRRKKTVAGPAP